ncbi:MAG: SDR family oxidoreductase [Rhodobacterales bacterium]|nr:SDR family oxidoreductase [Rhodobacterales bacterium]MDX5389649.1 SDR family oxidoreductase [Rhodobacterales bacterium]MDX5489346.1 SDR family oxidoreductase [Rhodobacterales bacterium]
MDIAGKTALVTGGAQGIGLALAQALKQSGASRVVIADLRRPEDTPEGVDEALICDVSDPAQIKATIDHVETTHGPIDIMCSNAGIATGMDTTFDNIAFADPAVWDRAWAVNVMAHVHAARVLIPRMKARGGGYFLHTISAAGLLSQVGSAVYSTTKHAAVGFAESLAIGHRDDGIRVSMLCPQGVATPMLEGIPDGPQLGDGVLSPETVADAAIEGIRAERFVILPHPAVAGYMRAKVENYDRWIGGMAKLQRSMKPG